MSESRGTALARQARRIECERLGHVPFDPLPDDMHPPAGWDVCGRCYTTYRNAIEELDGGLSTQEESVQVHVRRDDGPDDTYLVRRASQEAPKA